MTNNVTETIITPEVPNVIPNEHINLYVPYSSTSQHGLSKFYSEHFTVVDGQVKIKPAYIQSILAQNFQPKYDDTLVTNDKTVVGAIKELNNNINIINNNIDESLDRSIRYVRYVAPNALLNGPTSGAIVKTIPGPEEPFEINGFTEYFNINDEYKGTFTVEGMTKYLTDENIDTNEDDLFFAIRRNIKPYQYGGQLGFIVELPEVTNVEIVQLFLWGIYQNLQLKLYVNDGNTWTEQSVFFNRQSRNSLNVYRIHINKNIKSIKLVQEGNEDASYRFIVKGIEIFAPTTDGSIELVQRNDVVSKWDTFDAKTLIENVTTALNNTKDVLAKEGKEGGWPVLDGSEKIFAHYIPSIVKTDYEIIDIDWSQIDENTMTIDEINAKINELAFAKLITLSNMEQGDVAALIKQETDEYGYIRGKIIKSWMLLGKSSLGYTSPENWYEQSVATAGSSAFAKQSKQSENSVKVGGIAFEGIYNSNEYDNLVNNGLIRDETIYIVEV